MSEHRYDHAERTAQLRELAAALEVLLPLVEATPEVAGHVAGYRGNLDEARRMLSAPFHDEKITELGRSVKDLYYRHREWEPPHESFADGIRHDADWFLRLEPALQRVLKAADTLRCLGYYEPDDTP